MGTTGHQMAEEVVRDGTNPRDYLGREFGFWSEGGKYRDGWLDTLSSPMEVEHKVCVDETLVDAVVSATDFVKQLYSTRGGALFIEQSVSISQITDEENATGSADVLILAGNTLVCADYKFGTHQVSASSLQSDGTRRANTQLAMYALGAIHDFQMFHEHEITEVTLLIVQPLLNRVSEFSCSVDELRKVEVFLREKALEAETNPVFVPSYEACLFCRAKNHCAARRAVVYTTALDGFEDEPVETYLREEVSLPEQYAKVAFVKDWCKSIEEAALEAATAGNLPGYKVVEGQKGDRAWDNPAEVEAELQRMRLKKEEIYNLKLKSPTQLEKSKALGKTQFTRIFSHVERAPGKPTIAPIGDPRPALSTQILDNDFDFES